MQATLNVLAVPVKQELFAETVHLTGVIEYGISWQERAPLPYKLMKCKISVQYLVKTLISRAYFKNISPFYLIIRLIYSLFIKIIIK